VKHWKTTEIKTLLESVPHITLVGVFEQGSEMTTEQLVYDVDEAEDRLYVRGFVTDHKDQLLKGDNVDVEIVEVTTEYSDGVDSSNPENVIARALIHAALLKAGYQVVKSLEPYF
jgi:hypothetical protein